MSAPIPISTEPLDEEERAKLRRILRSLDGMRLESLNEIVNNYRFWKRLTRLGMRFAIAIAGAAAGVVAFGKDVTHIFHWLGGLFAKIGGG